MHSTALYLLPGILDIYTDRTGHRPGTAWSHAQCSPGIEPRFTAATCPKRRDGLPADLELCGQLELAILDQADLRGCPPHIKRNDIGIAMRRRKRTRCDDPSRRAGFNHI